jgi:hypothetical protein
MGDVKVKKCSSCGEAIEIDAAFCTNCGGRFMENTNVKKCSSCGETMKPGDAFCKNCGSRFEEKETQGTSGISPTGDVYFKKSMTILKILITVLALLLIIALGAIGYLYFSGRYTDTPHLVQQSIPTPSETELNNSDPGDASNANTMNEMESVERKVLQKHGTVAGGKPLIETDRNIYTDGEEIRVYFYNAPGYSKDWICVVPAGSRNTEAGDYQYIPRQRRGVLTFKPPRPGRYEARAYYGYSPGRYVVSARYGFTVQMKN